MTWRQRSRVVGRRPAPGRLAVVTFDATGTLFHAPRLGAIYAEVLVRHGLLADEPTSRRTLDALIPEVWRELACSSDPRRDRFASHPRGARGYWYDVLVRLCQRLEIGRPSPFAAAELFDRFAHAGAWELYADVVPALEGLRRRGLRLAVISNWDERLPALLARLGIGRLLEATIYSAAAGVEKPHPLIFQRALAALRVAPEEALHVGDRQLEDVEGAEGAGMHAWRIDRRRAGARLDDWLDEPGAGP